LQTKNRICSINKKCHTAEYKQIRRYSNKQLPIMKRINEIFYSLQGEGRNTGRAAIFIRFAGCNLRCPFCDTEFSEYNEMNDTDIIAAISAYPSRFVVLTGGEPTLQADNAFIALLHANGYEVAMETNGTHPVPAGVDWITVSPKESFAGKAGTTVVRRCNELKCIFDGHTTIANDYGIEADYYFLQPCDTGCPERNSLITQACIEYILRNPKWRLSLQTHKLTGFK